MFRNTGSDRLKQGRFVALTGVILVALSLRTSIASLSPIVEAIRSDIGISVTVIALLGVLPPACFALFGFVGTRAAAHVGIENSLAAAMAVIVLGHLLRAFSPNATVLIAGTLMSLAGMAVGNVLLPPVVKRYFPDRAGVVTSLYATLIAVSTAVPPLVAAPVAALAGWRVSLAMWSLLGAVAIVPWAQLALSLRRRRRRNSPVRGHVNSMHRVMWRSRLAWSLGVIFSVSAMNGYAMFAWMPTLLTETAGLTVTQAGASLSLYAAMGIPLALLVPLITERFGGAFWLLAIGMGATILGNAGLALLPTAAPIVWVIIAGLGPLLFPACLTMFHLRARTEDGAASLSGFAQTIGYVLGLAGPLVVGLLYQSTGEWKAPLAFLAAVAIPGLFAAKIASQSAPVEDMVPSRLDWSDQYAVERDTV